MKSLTKNRRKFWIEALKRAKDLSDTANICADYFVSASKMDIPASGDRFNLKWNNHAPNFIQVFAEHQNTQSLVDVTLLCEGEYIKAHKLILSACSDYFNSIFQMHDMPPMSVILLHGAKIKDLKYIIQFMYHGEVKVLDADLAGVLALGQGLRVKGLSSVKLKSPAEGTPHTNCTEIPTNHINNHVKTTPKSDLTFQSIKRELQRPLKSPELSTAQPIILKLPDSILPSEVPKSFPTNNRVTSLLRSQSKTENRSESTDLEEIPPKKKRAVEENGQQQQPQIPDVKHNQLGEENTETPCETSINFKPTKPMNAFMIFARDWRPKLAAEFPGESTKEISLRLGNLWKTMQPEMKKIFYIAAKKTEEEQTRYSIDSEPATIGGKKRTSGEITGGISPLDPLMMVEVDEGPIYISEDD